MEKFREARSTQSGERPVPDKCQLEKQTGFFKTQRSPLLMAALAASLEACGGLHVQVPMFDGTVLEVGASSASSGAEQAHPSPRPETILSADPTEADRQVYHTHRIYADNIRQFVEGAQPDPTQLPHLQGTSLLHVRMNTPQEFQRGNLPTAEQERAIDGLFRAATSGDVNGVSISYGIASARISGGAHPAESSGGMRLNVQLVPRDQIINASPRQPEGLRILSSELPHDDLDTRGVDEGECARGMGHDEREAAAAAMTRLINHLTDFLPARVRQGSFTGPNGGAHYELSYSQRGGVIYLHNIHTTFEHLPSGTVRATIDGGPRNEGRWRIIIPTSTNEIVANGATTEQIQIAP